METDGILARISKLPESLLVQIISLLPTTKEAFRTCLVSKRWQYLWTFTDNLTLVCSKELEAQKFISFVNYAFAKRNSSKIEKFQVEIFNMPRYHLHMDQWISYAVDCKVEHVILKSNIFKYYALPQILYDYSSLITLNLSFCSLDKGVDISWKLLKTMKLMNVELDDELVVKLLSGCPALENMELSLFHGFRRMEINNSNLKRLKLENFWSWNKGADERSLEIVAPYLQNFEISGHIEDFQCRLLDVSSLVSASLTFDITCLSELPADFGSLYRCPEYHHVFWTIARDYVKIFGHVKDLAIGTWFAEVLFMLQLDGVKLPEMKCKCLTLKFLITKYNLYGVATLLQASPHVETLNIELDADVISTADARWHCSYESSYLCEGDNISLESWISDFTFPRLKRVNVIIPSMGMCQKELHDKTFELSKFLLKNAKVLEKFIIKAKRLICPYCRKNCVYSSRLAAKLLGCPRPSTNFMMTLHESDFP